MARRKAGREMNIRFRKICLRCHRTFASEQSLAQHMRHAREGGKARRDRLCPDKRTAEEAREIDLIKIRLKTTLGLLGRHP